VEANRIVRTAKNKGLGVEFNGLDIRVKPKIVVVNNSLNELI